MGGVQRLTLQTLCVVCVQHLSKNKMHLKGCHNMITQKWTMQS